jgi:DNA-binding XRE family transcriptional regulator
MDNNNDIKSCIHLICSNLPVLRGMLNLTQDEMAAISGTSRQKIIQFEHFESKVTKSILVALVTYFSLRSKSVQFLNVQGLYKNRFVQDIGFTEQVISYIIENHINEIQQ